MARTGERAVVSVHQTSERQTLTATHNQRYINLDEDARFVPASVLKRSYVRYEESRAPHTPPHVSLPARSLTLGIVDSAVPEIARAVSSLLSCSLEQAKNDHGGHLPVPVVERVQREIISPHGVANLWGAFGHRFVLSRPVDAKVDEIVATVLVARRKGTIFFLTGRYNNVRHSRLERLLDTTDGWLDRFAFPPPARFKPKSYHHIANYVVAKSARGQGLGRLLLESIVERYALDHLTAHSAPIEHSQHLLCGRGFWQIGDPPWLARMERLGFTLRWGAESFFIEHDHAPLPPIFDGDRKIGNLEYNRSFQMPERYLTEKPKGPPTHHLLGRRDEVIRLSQDPRAKLQYFQTMFDFVGQQ
ncbi:MAG: GNAT superfamily N-acetyltransferase [Myxococcota bacterium]